MAKKAGDKFKEAKDKSRERRLEKAKKFADELVDKLGDKVICVVVWGSVSRGEHTAKSDIDTFVLLDDTKLDHDVPLEIQEKIRFKVLELARKIDKRITLQYFTFLTDFWDSLRNGEPLTIDVLRLGIPVYDRGVFWPAKRLLMRGRIFATREAVVKRMQLAGATFKRMEHDFKRGMPFHLEQVITSAAQAPVMLIGRSPPGKFEIPIVLEELFVKPGILEKEYVDMAKSIKEFADKAEKEEGKISGEDLEKHFEMTAKFLERIDKLLKELGEKQAIRGVLEDYKVFLRANVAALKSKNINPPEKKEDLPKIVSETFQLDKKQMSLFKKWDKILDLIKDKKEKDIDQKEIYELRYQTREFIQSIGKDLQKQGLLPKPPEMKEEQLKNKPTEEKPAKAKLSKKSVKKTSSRKK